MGSVETDDQFTIVNRSTEYRISKKLIRKIPYFDAMLRHDSLESKENKAVLDFDEKTLKWILNLIENDFMFIKMANVIKLATIADYFGMKDLLKDCTVHFYKVFTIEHLPAIIHQVTPTSKLVNSGALNAFICRHFLKIADSFIWLDFSFEAIEYICKLDLKIRSERQVFDVILKWIIADPERKSHLKALLNLVRWCHMEPKHLADIDKNSLVNPEHFGLESFRPIDEEKCSCTCIRTEQENFITIEEFNTHSLRIRVFDSDFDLLMNQFFQLDTSIPLDIFHDEHVSDIVFDSGRQMIRVDWKKRKYRLLDFFAYKAHYLRIRDYFIKTEKDCCGFYNFSPPMTGCSLLEVDEKFIFLNSSAKAVRCWQDPRSDAIYPKIFNPEDNFMVTILDNNIYMLTENLTLVTTQFDRDVDIKILIPKITVNNLKFDDLFLTSSQSYDDIIIFFDKSSKEVFSLNVRIRKWSSMGLLINYNYRDYQKDPKLLTFTSAYVSKEAISPCLNLNPVY